MSPVTIFLDLRSRVDKAYISYACYTVDFSIEAYSPSIHSNVNAVNMYDLNLPSSVDQ